MERITPLDRFRCPYGGQDVEFQQVDHDQGGMSLMRIRIREGKRFTVFDVDPLTAQRWGEAMAAWGRGQAEKPPGPGE